MRERAAGRFISAATILALVVGCPTDDPDPVEPANPDAPYSEIALEATESYLERKAEYLDACYADHGPGQGGVYGQVCRVARGADVHVEMIEEACQMVSSRQDTADFKVAALVRLLYLDRADPSLDPATRSLIEDTVLGFKYWIDEPGQDQMCYWSENHQALYHANEMLAGQLFPDEVFANDGATGRDHVAHAERLADRWLDFRGRFGFSEWHSNVYFNEDLPALVNLADFADDAAIRTKARAVLDLLAFDMLNNYYKGYFATVHGRTYENKFLEGLHDSTKEAAWLMLGLGDFQSTGNFSASFLATSDGYWIPGLLEDVAAETEEVHEHRQRDGIDVADGPDWGIGYEDQDDIIFWAGMAALIAPQVIEGTVAMLDDLELWDGFLFGGLPEWIQQEVARTAMRILHNLPAMRAAKDLHRAQTALTQGYARLSSGLRITRAADDAAGLAISESLRADIASLRVAERNANDGIGFAQVTESAIGEISSMFIRLRELATQSASETIGDDERSYLSIEFEALKDEILRVVGTTEFNGIYPMTVPAGDDSLAIQVGIHAGDTIDVTMPHLCVDCLFLGTQPEYLGIDTAVKASDALWRIDYQIGRMSGIRATLGAQQNRLTHAIRNLEVAVENTTAAESRIRDVDFASESAYLRRAQILARASIAVMAQANNAPKMVLRLLG